MAEPPKRRCPEECDYHRFLIPCPKPDYSKMDSYIIDDRPGEYHVVVKCHPVKEEPKWEGPPLPKVTRSKKK